MAVVVRWAPIDAVPTSGAVVDELLDRDQRIRMEAFVDDADRRRFVGARLLLHAAVAEVTGARPDDVTVRQRCPHCGGPHGRPVVEVAERHAPLVSVAHAGGIAIVAVARRAVGIDLEPGRPDDGDLRSWVRTEALLKATGHGLDVDPSLVQLAAPTDPPRLLGWHGPGRRPVVRLADLEIAPDYVVAVARLGRTRLDIDARSLALTTSPTATAAPATEATR